MINKGTLQAPCLKFGAVSFPSRLRKLRKGKGIGVLMALPPIEYLLDCSLKSLEDLELAALNRSQQCLKAARAEFEEACAQREAAGVARWLRENRETLLGRRKESEEVIKMKERKSA